jgi:PAS domain S-box-containing protein
LTNAITDNAAVALFIMDEHQHCIFMNPAAEKLTGFTMAEVRGRPLHNVIHHTRPDGSHFPLEECVIDRAFPERAQMQGEEVFVHKDGHFYPVAFTASPIVESGRPVGTVIEVQDITARKLTEMGLARSERRYRSFVEASAQVVWRVNPAAEVDEPIPAWQSYTGQTFSQAQGLGWMNAIRESDRPSVVAAWQKAVNTGGVYEVEYLLLRHDGAWRAVRARGVPVRDDAGTIVEWIGTCIDITLQKKIEEELRLHREELTRLVEERTAQLLHAAEERRRAEDALRQNEKLAALGQLTGGVAHDFNNMLQVVTSGAQLLKQVALTEDRRASILESMIQAGQRARDLTNRLLAFARRQSLAPETFDLNARLADVAELLRRTMRGGAD